MKKSGSLLIVIICAYLHRAHCFTVVFPRVRPARKLAPVAVAHLSALCSRKARGVHFPLKTSTSNIGLGVALPYAAVSAFVVQLFKFDKDWVSVKEMLDEIDEIDQETDALLATLAANIKENEPRLASVEQLMKEADESLKEVKSLFWWSFGFNVAGMLAYVLHS
jgi:hypothetical protein